MNLFVEIVFGYVYRFFYVVDVIMVMSMLCFWFRCWVVGNWDIIYFGVNMYLVFVVL